MPPPRRRSPHLEGWGSTWPRSRQRAPASRGPQGRARPEPARSSRADLRACDDHVDIVFIAPQRRFGAYRPFLQLAVSLAAEKQRDLSEAPVDRRPCALDLLLVLAVESIGESQDRREAPNFAASFFA